MSQYLITDEDGKGHLPVRKSADGPLDHGLMGAAHAALFSPKGFRGKPYEGPGKGEARKKLKGLYEQEGMDWPEEEKTEASAVFSAIAISFAATDAAPEGVTASHEGELHVHTICTTGTWVHPRTKQEITLTTSDLEDVAANFAVDPRGEVPCDYEHASERIGVAMGGPVPAAGWIKKVWVEAGAKLKAAIEWTKAAAGFIEGKEYKYVSPAMKEEPDYHTGANRGLVLTSLALTNQPVMQDLPALQFSSVAGETLVLANGGDMEKVRFHFSVPDLSDGQLRDQLQAQINDRFGSFPNDYMRQPWVRDVYDGYVVFERDGKFWRLDFTVADGNAKLTDGEAKEMVSAGYVEAGKSSSQMSAAGGKGATMKHLELKKLTGGDHDGHHGVFDGSDQVGCITPEHMKDHIKAAMGAEADGLAMSAIQPLFSEFGVVVKFSAGAAPTFEGLDEVRAQLVRGRAAESAEKRNANRTLLFGAVTDGAVDDAKLDKVIGDHPEISTAEFREFQRFDSRFKQAFSEGKIAPSERAVLFSVFSATEESRKAFDEWAKSVMPRISLRSTGIGSNELVPVDDEVDTRVKQILASAAGQGLTYPKALKQLFAEEPTLEKRYQAAHSKSIAEDAPAA